MGRLDEYDQEDRAAIDPAGLVARVAELESTVARLTEEETKRGQGVANGLGDTHVYACGHPAFSSDASGPSRDPRPCPSCRTRQARPTRSTAPDGLRGC